MAQIQIRNLNSGTIPDTIDDSAVFPGDQDTSPNNFPAGLNGFLYFLARGRRVEVTTGTTVTIAAPTHMCRMIVLSHASAAISLANMGTVHDGFTFAVWNRTGGDYSIPASTGATKDFLDVDGEHTKIKDNGIAVFEVAALGSGRRLIIQGATAP